MEPMARTSSLLLLALTLVLTRAAAAETAAGKENKKKIERIQLSGIKRLPEKEVRAVMGPVPEQPCHSWCEEALQRILRLYRGKGYTYARGWISRTDEGRGPVAIEIDEGKIDRIGFSGTGAVRLLMLKVDIYLPGSVFHKPTLDAAMKRIIKKYSLANAYYRVRELSPVAVSLDRMVAKRMLHVYIVGRERFGWGIDIGLSSTWGFVPAVSVAHQGMLFDDDKAYAKVGIGFPYRKFLYEEQADFQWVHGFVQGAYRPTRLASKHLEPFIEFSTTASRYRRSDMYMEGFKLFHADVLLNLRLRPVPIFAATLGLGYDSVEVFHREMEEGYEDALPDAPAIRAFAARLDFHFEPTRRAIREDLRTFIDTDVSLAYSDSEQWVVRGGYKAQLVLGLLANNLILSSHGMMHAGNVRFWDQEPLSRYLRVFFDNKFWVEEAMQATAELRFALFSDKVKVGGYFQGALFTDQRALDPDPNVSVTDPRGERFHAEAAMAFGPGVHLLLFDNFAIDVYYGFGFTTAPKSKPSSGAPFHHNYYVSAGKVF